MRGFLIVDKVNQCVGKPKLGIGIAALAGNAWAADECIICPEHQRKGIEEK